VPIRLTDTAGLRETVDQVEAIGVERATNLMEGADVLLWLGAPIDAPPHPRLITVHAKSDLAEPPNAPRGTLAVSARTGAGLGGLLTALEASARTVLPSEDSIALNRRQAARVQEAASALKDAEDCGDLVLVAEALRLARTAFDRLTGRAGVEEVLDALFGRFCLGK
jgi:tRNA modification GTPase